MVVQGMRMVVWDEVVATGGRDVGGDGSEGGEAGVGGDGDSPSQP